MRGKNAVRQKTKAHDRCRSFIFGNYFKGKWLKCFNQKRDWQNGLNKTKCD